MEDFNKLFTSSESTKPKSNKRTVRLQPRISERLYKRLKMYSDKNVDGNVSFIARMAINELLDDEQK